MGSVNKVPGCLSYGGLCPGLHHTEVLSHMLAPWRRVVIRNSSRVEPGILMPNSMLATRDTQMPQKAFG